MLFQPISLGFWWFRDLVLATFSWNQIALFAEPSSEADLRGVIEYGSGGTL